MFTPFSVVILAGGLATRLGTLTQHVPKSLLPINGKPFIAHQLELLQHNHVREVTLCVGHLGDQIQNYVGDGEQFHLKVHYSFEGPQLLGTAGAIKRALPQLADCFFVLYGDSYLLCDYQAVQQAFIQQQKPALMTVFQNLGQWDTSNVEFSEGTIKTYDKINRNERMHYIDYGLGLFTQQAFANVPDAAPYDLAVLYQQLLKDQQLASYEVRQRFYEVGSLSGIQELSQYLQQGLADKDALCSL